MAAEGDDWEAAAAFERIAEICEYTVERLSLEDPALHTHGWLSAIKAIADHGLVVIRETRGLAPHDPNA